jgi:hypothetical protein
MRNQGLLKTLDECEYPADFLVARLLGKKGALFRNWEFLITGSDTVQSLQNTPFYPYLKKYAAPGIWRFLRNEHMWVYSKMNPSLRKNFTSYFVYHEINTLLVCLRYLHSRNEIEPVMQELHNSLLHNDIQDILTSGFDFAMLLNTLEACLSNHSSLFVGLRGRYENKGLAALELFIWDAFFAFIFSLNQPFQMKSFIQHLVDFHNSLSLAKTIRWQIEAEPSLISGGVVPLDRFKRAYFLKDMTPILRTLHLRNHKEVNATVQQLETALLNLITRKLQRKSYQRTVTGDILFYLWKQYCYTRNISMVLNTILLDDEPVRNSIVA